MVLAALFALGCDKEVLVLDEAKTKTCMPSTENYLTGKIMGTEECWNNNTVNYESRYEISSTGTGTCGQGYENYPFPYMSLGIIAAENEDSSFKRYLTIEIPFACDAFSTKAKFYNLISAGNYGYQEGWKSYGKFAIEYTDANGSFSTDNIGQGNNTLEILKVEEVFLPGGNVHHALRVKMKINCILADTQGKVYGSLEDVEVSGMFLRQKPWGETYDDWEE